MSLRFVVERDCCIMARRSKILLFLSSRHASSQGDDCDDEVSSSSARAGSDVTRKAAADDTERWSKSRREVGGAKASTDETSSFLGKISYTHTLMAIVMSANSNLAAEGKLKRRIMVATHDATNGENEPTCTHVFVREQTRNASSQS